MCRKTAKILSRNFLPPSRLFGESFYARTEHISCRCDAKQLSVHIPVWCQTICCFMWNIKNNSISGLDCKKSLSEAQSATAFDSSKSSSIGSRNEKRVCFCVVNQNWNSSKAQTHFSLTWLMNRFLFTNKSDNFSSNCKAHDELPYRSFFVHRSCMIKCCKLIIAIARTHVDCSIVLKCFWSLIPLDGIWIDSSMHSH